ncbi:MAG: serine protease, partial [Actinomycetota bacterium]|nr:serine protease [Actinomycetota bacterium]
MDGSRDDALDQANRTADDAMTEEAADAQAAAAQVGDDAGQVGAEPADNRDVAAGPHRGAVSPQTAAVFGRPDGVAGSFAQSTHPTDRPAPEISPPDPVLAEAFGRPAGETATLQRDPLAGYGHDDAPAAPADPWRDPESMAALADPALTAPSS